MQRETLSDTLKLYAKYTLLSLRGQMQYRASFLLMTLGNLIFSGAEFLGIAALFSRFGTLQGWSLAQISVLYGVLNVAFAIAEASSRGFDMFHELVKAGEFDRVLLRPRSTAFQIAAQDFQLMRVGRFVQGLVILGWGITHLSISWTLPNLLLIPLMILGGTCLFYGLFILQAVVSFWTVESIELMNILTYGGTEIGQYPMSIYPGFLRHLFTFLIPIACVNYLPSTLLFARPDASPWFYFLPLVGIVFLVAMLQLWEFGVKHYRSTGS